MRYFKDHDFRIAVLFSSPILLHILSSFFVTLSSYYNEKMSVPNQATLNLDFVVIEMAAFVVAVAVIFSSLKLAKTQSKWLKLVIGFVYSTVSTYYVVYKFVINDFYYIRVAGGDWGYLAVILGWPIFFVVSIPVLILFYKTMESTDDTKARTVPLLMILPTIVGVIVLLVLTFSGRLIFQKTYEQKKLQLTQDVKISNVLIKTSNLSYNDECKCVRPNITGSFEISNNVSFPVTLSMYREKYGYSCKFDQRYEHKLKVGLEVIDFDCFTNEKNVNTQDYSANEFKFYLQEFGNFGVRVTK